MSLFAERASIEQVERGDVLAPRFDAQGLLPAIVIEAGTGAVLMLGFMNRQALEQTLRTGEAHFWSRSREALWRKGAHSGFTQRVSRILVDDDQDALVVEVVLAGPGSCHVGYRSCFYREIVPLPIGEGGRVALRMVEQGPVFDAATVYAGLPNPTRL